MKEKSLRFYLAGSIMAVLLFLATIELVTRAVSWAGGKGFSLALHELDPTDRQVTDIYQWHPFVGFTFQPDIVIAGGHPNQRERSRVYIDAHGFLAPDRGLERRKPANEIRIATIGASTTANLNLAFDDNWPGRLGRLVEKSRSGMTIRVINAGIPGFDTAQSIGNLALRVMPFEPDVVIIYHAYNDLKAVAPEGGFAPDYSHIHRRPYGFHETPPLALQWLNQSMAYVRARNSYRELKRADAHASVLSGKDRSPSIPTEAEAAFARHIRALIGVARAGGARVVLSSFATLHDPARDDRIPENRTFTELQRAELPALLEFTPGLTLDGIFEGFNRYNRALETIAAQEKTGWVDNARRVPHEDRYFVDRVHFTRAGAALMADNFLPAVLEQLPK